MSKKGRQSARAMEQLRRQIEEELSYPLTDEAWAYLVERGEVDKVLGGSEGIGELLSEVGMIVRIFGRSALTQPDAPTMLRTRNGERDTESPPSREEILARLVAAEASKDPDVEAFRRDPSNELDGATMSWGKVETWLGKWPEWPEWPEGIASSPPAWWITELPVPLNVANQLVLWVGRTTLGRDRSAFEPHPDWTPDASDIIEHVSFRILKYLVPDDAEERRIAIVKPGGAPDRLRLLSERLSERYGWTPAQATVFVLTDLPPAFASLSANHVVNDWIPSLARITLTIDPAMSPREVADKYRDLRAKYVRARQRDLSEKHLFLALFTAMRTATEPWAQSMERWNQQHAKDHPAWIYDNSSNFGRDCNEARRRILGQADRSRGVEDEDG